MGEMPARVSVLWSRGAPCTAIREIGMDYATLKAELDDLLPFNRLLELRIAALGDGEADVVMAYRKELTNHLGTLHATTIFGSAEAASGYAVSGALLTVIRRARAFAISSSIAYHRFAKSAITAKARTKMAPADIRSALANDSKLEVEVGVEVSDSSGNSVATASFRWMVMLRANPAKVEDFGDKDLL